MSEPITESPTCPPFRWEDPPPLVEWEDETTLFVNELRNHPDQWARYPHDMAHDKIADMFANQHAGTDWTMRKLQSGRYGLWGRCLS